jgi:ubiquitin
MLIYLKTIKGEIFTLEVQPTNTMLELKYMVQELKGYTPDSQRFIFAGKNIEDQRTVESYNIVN